MVDVSVEELPRIKQLATDVANKIAAGEVVERPASVLKELLENSIDAKATKIDVIVAQGGIQEICVIDNGCGILKEDLLLALMQHATSKIDGEDDLNGITSLGFRGEALASINSVAKFSITSNTKTQQHAWSITNQNIIAAAHPVGTSVKMQDLFYNVPARRKFLRSPRTEYLYLEEIFRRIALSHFEIAFTLSNNEKIVKNLPRCVGGAGMAKRVENLCGKQVVQQSLTIDCEQNGMRIWGWLGTYDSARSQEPHQYFFINRRVIKDRLINHAIRQAYAEFAIDGKMPFYCLYLELDPIVLDVNVHPTKHEVRFRDARIIHAFVTQTLKAALSGATDSNDNTLTIKQYKNSLQPAKEDSEQTIAPRVLTILSKQVILATLNDELYVFDIASAERAILQQQLQLKPAPICLAVPISINLSSTILTPDFIFSCLKVGIEIAGLGPDTAVIRALPLALHDHAMNWVNLFTALYKQNNLDNFLKIILGNIKFAPILSEREAYMLIQNVLQMQCREVYSIFSADNLRDFLHVKSQKTYQI